MHHHQNVNYTAKSTISPVSSDEENDDQIEMEDDAAYTHSNPSQTSIESGSKMDGLAMDIVKYRKSFVNAANLPNEILFQIFRQLSTPNDLFNCLCVCKSWLNCTVDYLWYRPVFASYSNSLVKLLITLTRTNQTLPYALMIRRLNLTLVADIVTDKMIQKLEGCRRLERLTLSGCKCLSDNGIAELIINCPQLIAIDLSDIANIGSLTLEAIAKTCHKLQGLNLSNCINVTDDSLAMIGENCVQLRRIKLSHCSKLTDASVNVLIDKCQQLLELDLSACDKVTNAAIQLLFHRCPVIREVRLMTCLQITDTAFEPYQVAALTDSRSISPIIQYEHLRHLDLSQCSMVSDQALILITTYAKRLRNLALAKCRNVTDYGVIEGICRLGRHLHYLHLGHCSNLTDLAVCNLVRHCPRLRYLDLACCNLLTDVSVSEIASLQKLRRIGLVKCTTLTDDGIYALVDRGIAIRTLERIHLSYCLNLTASSIRELVLSTKHLTHLSLTGVPHFFRREVQQFCRQAPEEMPEHQRMVFCVFSGKGVIELREWLIHCDDISVPENRRFSPYNALRVATQQGFFPNSDVDDEELVRAIETVGLFGMRVQDQEHQHQQASPNGQTSASSRGLAAAVGSFLNLRMQRRTEQHSRLRHPRRNSDVLQNEVRNVAQADFDDDEEEEEEEEEEDNITDI